MWLNFRILGIGAHYVQVALERIIKSSREKFEDPKLILEKWLIQLHTVDQT